MSDGVIYLLTFPDGRKYVGQTVNLRARLTRHRAAASPQSRVHVSRAWGEVGEPSVAILCRVAVADLDEMERHHIREQRTLFPHGLNRDTGGNLGASPCEDTRALHREANLRRYADPSERERTRRQVLQRYQDPAERAASRQQQIERYKNPAARQKTSEAMRLVGQRPEEKARKSRASKALWDDPEYRKRQLGTRDECQPRGENCSWAKLTAEDVVSIRAARAARVSIAELAARYRVSESLVSQIARRLAWKHIP